MDCMSTTVATSRYIECGPDMPRVLYNDVSHQSFFQEIDATSPFSSRKRKREKEIKETTLFCTSPDGQATHGVVGVVVDSRNVYSIDRRVRSLARVSNTRNGESRTHPELIGRDENGKSLFLSFFLFRQGAARSRRIIQDTKKCWMIFVFIPTSFSSIFV